MALTQIKASNIADGTVVAADIADAAITQSKIHSSVVLGGPSLGTNAIIRTNATEINENITFPTSAPFSNGSSVGPITITGSYTVTIPAGNTYTIT